VERDQWVFLYGRLATAYNRTRNADQVSVYYEALGRYPSTAVEAAVTTAIRESRGWPTAAELAEYARAYLIAHQAPASVCHRCHGDKFTVHHCAGVSAPDAATPPMPVDRTEFCGRDWVHVDHAYARYCPMCHPAARTEPAA
jgi:hypothetical protein